MAYLVTGGDDDVIHAMTHGIMTRDDLSYLRERIDNAVRTASGVAARYLDVARESIVKFDFTRLRDNVDSMRERFGRRWDEDRVKVIVELVEFQHAKPAMRRLIMAEPRTRKMYYDKRLDGYDGLYEDDDVGVIGRRHEAYREVMNGSYVENEHGEDQFVTYLGVADEHGDQPLSVKPRHAVRRTWEEQKALIDRGGQDFTSALRKTF